MKINYQTNWIINDIVGIFLSIAVAAGILSFETQWLGQPGTLIEKLDSLGIALIGGLVAGSILAWFQWRILKHRFQNLSWIGWWRNTVLAFIAGWLLAISPSFFENGTYAMGQVIAPFDIPTFTAIYGSILFGGVMGTFIGGAQWLELRKHQTGTSEWIGMNVFGWAAGFFAIVNAGFIFQSSLPSLFNTFLLTGIAGGLIAAICIAVITSLFFRKKMSV